jgi:hypothetical protein
VLRLTRQNNGSKLCFSSFKPAGFIHTNHMSWTVLLHDHALSRSTFSHSMSQEPFFLFVFFLFLVLLAKTNPAPDRQHELAARD